MKTKSVFAMIAFLLAIGTAVASEIFLPTTAWTHISEVPVQSNPCEQRLECEGGPSPCVLRFTIGDTPYEAKGYDGINPTAGNCGTQLTMNP